MNLPIPTQEQRTTPLSTRRQSRGQLDSSPIYLLGSPLPQERSRGRAGEARSFRRWALSTWTEAPVKAEKPLFLPDQHQGAWGKVRRGCRPQADHRQGNKISSLQQSADYIVTAATRNIAITRDMTPKHLVLKSGKLLSKDCGNSLKIEMLKAQKQRYNDHQPDDNQSRLPDTECTDRRTVAEL